jgi:hypothetical protein
MKKVLLGFLAMILCTAASARTNEPAQLILGQVFNAEGLPVSNARVIAYPVMPLEGVLPAAVSDKEGRFSIAVEQMGKFVLAASKMEEGYPNPVNAFYNPTPDALTEVMVEGNQAPPFVTIRLGAKAGKITGRIVDAETNQPVGEVRISLCRVQAPNYCQRHTAQQPLERFQFLVPAVPFTMHVSAPGYEDWYGNDGTRPELFQVAADSVREFNISLQRLSTKSGDDQMRPALDAPSPLLPADGAELDYFPRTTRLEWASVAGAASYVVEVEFCEGGKRDVKECKNPQALQNRHNPPPSGIKTTSYEFEFIGAQPGRWRVWAVDEQGRAGAKSDWSTFFYRQ